MRRSLLIVFAMLCVAFVAQAARNIENLDRGLVAVKTSSGVFLSWRVLGNDPSGIGFNIYRDGTKVNSSVITDCSNMTDANGTTSSTYTVRPVINGTEQAIGGTASVWASQSLTIKLNQPSSIYSPNDCSLGDVDGDGQWEIILKWDPSTSQDNSKSGKTDKVYLDCYELDGTQLWRIDLGYNIRAGAHYTQFLVGDYDGDGYAEVACKTAPGTKDGKGNYLSKGPAADDDDTQVYRNSKGYILTGEEYLTIFSGLTGEELATVNYNPARGTVSSWGDSYGNRVDRFLATNAYLGNNNNPSMVFCRGYYTRMAVTAYDWDGVTLSQRWYYNAATSGSECYGQGNHNLACGDVDGDGYDEIIHGACAIDHDGKFMYRTGAGHGDAMHFGDLNPDRDGLEVYCVHEETTSAYGYEMHDARTGAILGGAKTGTDNGRGIAADIDPNNRGYEAWSGGNSYVMLADGTDGFNRSGLSQNFRVYWDGDLQDELLDGGYEEDFTITKWLKEKSVSTIFTLPGKSCNTTKRTPNLSADLIGDWREEIISHNGSDELYVTTTVIPTTYKMYTLMHDPIYRNAISWQNTAYNQPPHLGFWLGSGQFPTPDINPIGGEGAVILDPVLTKHGGGSSSQSVEVGSAITDFYYSWENASTVTVTWQPFAPDGIVVTVDPSNKKVSFSGTPTYSGVYTYTLTTVSRAETQASVTGAFTFGDGSYPDAQLQKQGGGSSSQTIYSGSAITGFNYHWLFAESVEVSWEPSVPGGVEVTIDKEKSNVYFSGVPTSCGTYTYTIRTTGTLGSEATKTARITILGTSHVFSTDSSNSLWNDSQNWLDETVPAPCDTAYVQKGEANINSDIDAVTYVEQNGTFRIRASVTVQELHLTGGMLKSYTSTPLFQLNVSHLYIDAATVFNVGSTESSQLSLSGTMEGEYDITKTKLGVLNLNTNASDYSGRWILKEGKMMVSNADGLGSNGVTTSENTELIVSVASATGSIEMMNGSVLTLSADLTVSNATLGAEKLPQGVYSSDDYPEFISGSAHLIVTEGFYEEEGTSIHEMNVIAGYVSLSPNPAKEVSTLVYFSGNNGTATLQVVNASGMVAESKTVDFENGYNAVDLALSDYASGVYFVRVLLDSDMIVMKLIVK